MKWLLFVLLACNSEAVEVLPAEPDASTSEVEAVSAWLFAPTDAARAMTETAMAQWSTATRLDLREGEGGVVVELLDGITNEKGEPMCGRSLRSGGVVVAIQISTRTADRCRRPAQTLLHEMGHALAPNAPNNGHTPDGLMRAEQDPEATTVDAEAVAMVCGELHCYVTH